MRLKDSILRLLLVSLTVVSLTSCSELMDDLFGGDDEPIPGNYTTALAGKWRVVKAGYVENPSGEMAYVGEELPCSIEWIEFSNGQAHFHFSQEVVLNRQGLNGAALPSKRITDYTCPCHLDGEGFVGFVFGFDTDDAGTYHEAYKEWVDVDGSGEMFRYQANLWAYGKDEDYATTLILYSVGYNSPDYGYEMVRYDE